MSCASASIGLELTKAYASSNMAVVSLSTVSTRSRAPTHVGTGWEPVLDAAAHKEAEPDVGIVCKERNLTR